MRLTLLLPKDYAGNLRRSYTATGFAKMRRGRRSMNCRKKDSNSEYVRWCGRRPILLSVLHTLKEVRGLDEGSADK